MQNIFGSWVVLITNLPKADIAGSLQRLGSPALLLPSFNFVSNWGMYIRSHSVRTWGLNLINYNNVELLLVGHKLQSKLFF